MTTTTNTRLDAALAYAARAWQVIALHTPTLGGCSCGDALCGSPGKHPRYDAQLLPSGLKNASCNPGVLQIWWALWPDANIGLVAGAQSGFWALDIDPDKGGDLSLEQLLQRHGPLPDTPSARTGSGGQHLLFAHPGTPIRNRVRFAPGLDTRGDGGYIVAAPSLHASGAFYDWLISPDDTPLAPAPAWLLNLVCPPTQTAAAQQQHSTNGTHPALPKRTLNYLVFGAQNGTRNDELYRAAQQFYAAGCSQAEADQKLRPRARQDGLSDSEIDKTIASAYQSTFVSGPAAAPGTPPTGATQSGAPAASGAPPNTQAGTQAGTQKHSVYIAQALKQLGYTFRLNLCSDLIEVNGEPITDVVSARIRTDARDNGLKPLAAVEDTYMVEAANNAYHPIRDYLTGLAWDGQPHIQRCASALHGIDPPVRYPDGTARHLMAVYLRRWLIGVVAKTFDQHQNMMLVLAGPQRIGKSSWAQWLCALPAYFLRGPINVTDKDSDVRLLSYWIWEVSELDATTRRADVSALKDFITRDIVTVRKAYGRHDLRKPALASLIGTVNESIGFLVDDTGNRRFLVARIERVDWTKINQLDRDQIWAEAVTAYQAGEPWELQGAEYDAQTEQNKTHEVASVLEDWISAYFYIGGAANGHQMTAGEIINYLRTQYDIRLHGSERSQAMELARVLKHLGAEQIRTNSWRGYKNIMPKI